MSKIFDQEVEAGSDREELSKRRLKRVRGNTNLSFHYDKEYKGLSAQVSHGPLIVEWLEKIRLSLSEQVAMHSKVFALRIDLHFPTFYMPPEGQVFGNDYYDRFKRHLKRLLEDVPDARNHGLRLIAAREYGERDGRLHFHVLLLLNGNSIRSTGLWELSEDNLYSRLHEAWAFALGMKAYEIQGLIEFSNGSEYRGNGRSQAKGGGFLLKRGDHEMFADIFFASTYLAKYATKCFTDGCHPFLSSQLMIPDW